MEGRKKEGDRIEEGEGGREYVWMLGYKSYLMKEESYEILLFIFLEYKLKLRCNGEEVVEIG